MADGDESARKPIKIGLKAGGGPPPGYQWNVDILDRAHDDAMSFLNEDQYTHIVCQIRELASLTEPSQSQTVDVKPVQDIYEVRDKGGVLAKINVRIFFSIHQKSRTIAILGAIKKENNGPTPKGDLFTMRRRMRLYTESRGPAGSESSA